MWAGQKQNAVCGTQTMHIGLDFDETVTLAPKFWGAKVGLAKAQGHHITIVTYRFPGGDNADTEAFAREHGVPVVYTSGRQKSSVVAADVWIDDAPAAIPTPREIA